MKKRYNYQISGMDKSIASLGGTQLFTSLESHQGYCQVELVLEDGKETTFTCNHGFKQTPLDLEKCTLFISTSYIIII